MFGTYCIEDIQDCTVKGLGSFQMIFSYWHILQTYISRFRCAEIWLPMFRTSISCQPSFDVQDACAKATRCPCVSVAAGSPGLYGCLTNTCSEWTSASVSLKPSTYFMAASGLNMCGYQNSTGPACYPCCSESVRSHQYFMFAVQSSDHVFSSALK